MLISIRTLLLVATTLYQASACWLEDRQSPPGQLVDVGGYRLHLYVAGEACPTIVLDHSLGGVEGYFLIEHLATLARVCIYDRAGYGWSDHSPHPRTSEQIAKELDRLLTQAGIEPFTWELGVMTFEEGLELLEQVLPQGQLNKVQEVVFRHSWEGQSYKEIAEQFDYSLGFIKNTGSDLWKLLSDALGEKVTQRTFRSC